MSTPLAGRLLIDLYDGALGKTLFIATWDTDALGYLRSLTRGLAERKRSTAVLQEAPGLILRNCSSVALRVTEGYEDIEIVPGGADPGETQVVWRCSAEGWRDCCGLIEGLIGGGKSGHQYLRDAVRSVSQVTVELSYREGSGWDNLWCTP